ncbi:MAG: hypothetical protein LRY69_01440 [Gammaproteobacteria bacterium]|nr:hypothetical protein [Gammaproteobacteria bacterium]
MMNEMLYGKAAPLSARNIAIKASAYSTLNAILSLMIITGEEEWIVGFLPEETDGTGTEDASAIAFNLAFSALFAANSLQESRQKRSYELAKAYTLCCVNALNHMQKHSIRSQVTDETTISSPSPTPTFESDQTTNESSTMSDDAYHEETPLLPPNEKIDTPVIRTASLPVITEDHYKKVYKDGNILSFKGAISSEASKQRSYLTLATGIVFSIGFLILDITTLGVSLALRLSLGIAGIAIGSIVRYSSKIEQNKTNLYAKHHRPWLTDIFQSGLIAELSVYGLQPVESNTKMSSDTVGIKRQVSVDAEKFLAESDHQTAIGKIISVVTDRKTQLKDLERYIKNHLPNEYQQHNHRYFVAECLFQIRINEFSEDPHLIEGERENLFSPPTAEFFAREQAKGIEHPHQRIMMYISKKKYRT